jgi:hypothetical protein
MSKDKLYISRIVLAISAVAAFLALTYISPSNVKAQSVCSAGFNFSMPNTGNILSGVVDIELFTPTNVNDVTFYIGDEVLGAGSQRSGSSTWFTRWDTRLAMNDKVSVSAVAELGNDNFCETSEVAFTIHDFDNNDRVNLEGEIYPFEIFSLTNSLTTIYVEYSPGVESSIVHENAVISWSVKGPGNIDQQPNSSARYFSGPNEGDDRVTVTIEYSGQTLELDVDTDVVKYPYTTSIQDVDESTEGENIQGTNQPTLLAEEIDSEDSSQTDDSPEVTVEQPSETLTRIFKTDSEVNSCVVLRLGQGEFDSLVDQNRRPTHDEFTEYLDCYEDENYVLPSILTPVAPSQVKELEESRSLRMNDVYNSLRFIDDSSGSKKLLILSGVADPNAQVLIYIFSEPLVLATTADSDGNWSYSLEDPLAEGEHEVYALVEKGDGKYERSTVASFVIGSAEASEENPDGLSLNLVSEPTVGTSSRSTNLFLAGTIASMILVLIILTIYINHRRRSIFLAPTEQRPEVQGNDAFKDFNQSK